MAARCVGRFVCCVRTANVGRYIGTSIRCQKDARKVKNELKNNPFYGKYKDKLGRIINHKAEEDCDSVESVRGDEQMGATVIKEANQIASAGFPTGTLSTAPKLNSIMHMDMIVNKTVEEVTQIWKKYHSDKDMVCAIIPKEVYNEMYERALKWPMFVYPLPRSEGYEIMFAQFSNHRCYFTSLLQYKTHQENAPPCLTLSHYVDLIEGRGIVLMSGEVDTTFMSAIEAQYLANQVQLYYASKDSSRHELLEKFNLYPDKFDYTKVFELLQDGISHPATQH